jgi:hypothetical protein
MRYAWLAAAVVLTACGGHHRSSAPPHPDVLRGVRFATTPVVMLSPPCRVKNKRKCAVLTYDVYARLDRRVPRGKHLGWAEFAVAGSRPVDPIPRPAQLGRCLQEALFSDDPRSDHMPTHPGARVRLRLRVFTSQHPDTSVGEISTVIRLSAPDRDHVPGASRKALDAVGC